MTIETGKRWTLKEVDSEAEERLSQERPEGHPVIRRLLACRGINNLEEVKRFFNPELSDLHDPFLMLGMDKAVQRILEAIEWNERILVYGDFDVDGTTAVSIVYSFIKERINERNAGAGNERNSRKEKNAKQKTPEREQVLFYIPNRDREGCGLSQQGIGFAQDNSCRVIITLDCGIKNNDLIQYAQEQKIDVIVCDHHLPDEELPPAYAILNPKQSECGYPYKELSGCGIGFKLLQALARRLSLPDECYLKYLDLVAVSIAADIVPVDGENRVLAFYGIKKINNDPSLSIKTLVELAGITKKLHVSDLVFVIGPRVNAAGRMDDARKAVELFIETDPAKSREIVNALHTVNFNRKEVDRTNTQEALDLLHEDQSTHDRKSTVLYQPNWHKGVVGIVASRLIDHFYRPTIVLTLSNGLVTGSARSISGFNIYEAIHACRDLLENYGGHFFAAGMTLLPEHVDAFRERFEQEVASRILPEQLRPEILIDADLNFSDILPSFYEKLLRFEPYGPANMRPVFRTRNVTDFRGWSKVVKDTHLRFVVQQGSGEVMEGIGFGLAHLYPLLEQGPVDIVYTIDENEFNGKSKLQIKVLDVRVSE